MHKNMTILIAWASGLEQFESLVADDGAYEDGSSLGPRELYSYLKRVMYQRRSKVDPLWNQLVVAGWRNGAPLLGTVDLGSHGLAVVAREL